MDRKYFGLGLYILVWAVIFGPIYITPFLAGPAPGAFSALQAIYAPTCHQLASRSICYYQDGSFGDCDRNGTAVVGRQQIVDDHNVLGYKFPVCARDLAIYAAMLIGALIFPFVFKVDERKVPPLRYFIVALIPIAIDGGTQLIGLRTSTNELRILTGSIAGIVIPFYVIPMLNTFIIGAEKPKAENKEEKTGKEKKN